MNTYNRLYNCGNPHQGKYKRVLCVCSAGLLRSPTAAYVLSQDPYNYNTRACGVDEDFALVPLDEVLIQWAHEIVFMEDRHFELAKKKFGGALETKEMFTLNVPDRYGYREDVLQKAIKLKYDLCLKSASLAPKDHEEGLPDNANW